MTNFVSAWLATQRKEWAHDRTATVGASEIGQCARRVWFIKNEAERDAGYVDSRGAAARGDLIEREVWLPALRHWATQVGATILFAGDEQQTLTDGFLSVTPDALVIMADGEVVLRECKSIDPRVILDEAKAEHRAQVQTQLGIVAATTAYKPARAIIDYVDASFVDRVTSFEVTPDQATFEAAKRRALLIMDTVRAIDLRPEGKMAGGKECANCAWASRCAHEQAASVPAKAETPLADNAMSIIASAVGRIDQAGDDERAAKLAGAEAREEIKEILRAHGVRRVEDAELGFAISWSSVKGRETVDTKAAIAAGLDLSPFTRPGDPSERLTIKSKAKETA